MVVRGAAIMTIAPAMGPALGATFSVAQAAVASLCFRNPEEIPELTVDQPPLPHLIAPGRIDR